MRVNIFEVADIERAKNGKIYPKHSTLIALSATRGQVEMTQEDGEVETRYAVVVPKEVIVPQYMYYAISYEFEEFCYKYMTGINLKFEALKYLDITVCDMEKQRKYVQLMQAIERQERIESEIVERYKTIKNNMLIGMFPGNNCL